MTATTPTGSAPHRAGTTPERTRAVLVGVEEYNAGSGWRLDGPALDACRFARWLTGRGVPATRIQLLVAPAPSNQEAVREYGFPYRHPDRSTVEQVLYDEMSRGDDNELFFLYWGGHGVMDSDESRRLFYADAEPTNRRNLHLDKLLHALRTDHFPQRHQLLVVDACQNVVARGRAGRTLPTDLPPLGSPRPGREQHVLLAASPGERAGNVDVRRTGMFSEVLLRELELSPTGQWPPAAGALADAVQQRFAGLRTGGVARQSPSHLWFHAPHGERRIEVPPPATPEVPTPAPRPRAAPPGRLGLAALKAITEALLTIDDLLDPAVRDLVLRLLPAHIAHGMTNADNARAQVQHWVRLCAEFPGGLDDLVEVLTVVLTSEHPALRHAIEVLDTHRPDPAG